MMNRLLPIILASSLFLGGTALAQSIELPDLPDLPGIPEAGTTDIAAVIAEAQEAIASGISEVLEDIFDEAIDEAKSQIDEELDKVREELEEIGDDGQLANVDLQNILQKQQRQTLQTISNVLKILNDTALAIIRKIGG